MFICKVTDIDLYTGISHNNVYAFGRGTEFTRIKIEITEEYQKQKVEHSFVK